MKDVKLIIWSAVILAIVALLSYSVYFYYVSDAESGIISCNDEGECNIAMHIHADLNVEVCGEKIKFPLEKGDLSGQHTHKERNLMHFHGITSIDSKTNELLSPEDFTIKEFLNQMEFEFPEDCNGEQAELQVFVNNMEREELLEYPWKDDDKVKIIFE